MKDRKVLFREVQRFRQWYLIIPIVGISLFIWYAWYQQIIQGIPFGDKPASDAGMWVLWAIMGILFPLLFLSLRLVTEVRKENITLFLWPFYKKTVPYKDIKSAEACTYRPIMEYGGFGIRWVPFKGMAFNVSGNKGVRLHLKDGKEIMIGTRKPDELAAAIQSRLES